ncbi:MAG TPA: hypothetical protein VEF04_13565, partial [Blastocatellia bacterium]|nr:hypothetical protein [Blastocatellia bacterium]
MPQHWTMASPTNKKNHQTLLGTAFAHGVSQALENAVMELRIRGILRVSESKHEVASFCSQRIIEITRSGTRRDNRLELSEGAKRTLLKWCLELKKYLTLINAYFPGGGWKSVDKAALVESLVDILRARDENAKELTANAIRILIWIATTHLEVMIACNAVRLFKDLLDFPEPFVQSRAASGLVMITSHSLEDARTVMDAGVIDSLSKLLINRSTAGEAAAEVCGALLLALDKSIPDAILKPLVSTLISVAKACTDHDPNLAESCIYALSSCNIKQLTSIDLDVLVPTAECFIMSSQKSMGVATNIFRRCFEENSKSGVDQTVDPRIISLFIQALRPELDLEVQRRCQSRRLRAFQLIDLVAQYPCYAASLLDSAELWKAFVDGCLLSSGHDVEGSQALVTILEYWSPIHLACLARILPLPQLLFHCLLKTGPRSPY